MGMWNATCGLSGLTIFSDEVRAGVIFLGFSPQSGATSTPDERWRPLTLPLWGLYDGYGRVVVEDDNSAACRLARRALERECLSINGEAVPANDIDFLALQDGNYSREGNVTVQDVTRQEQDLAYMIVREDVWNMMAGLCPDPFRYLPRGLPKLSPEGFLGEVRGLAADDIPQARLKSFLLFSGLPSTSATILYHSLLLAGELAEEILSFIQVLATMEHLRKEWSPGTGVGSQQSTHRLLRRYMTTLFEVMDATPYPGYEE